MEREADTKANLFAPNRVSKKILKESYKATEEPKNEAEVFKEMGNVALQAERYDEAIQNYSTAIELFPSSAIYFSNRSAALLKKASTLTKPEEAKESGTLKERSLLDAKHAIVLDNRYMKGYVRQVASLQALERFTQALQACDVALAIDPTDQHFIEVRKKTDIAQKAALSSWPFDPHTLMNPNFPIRCDPPEETGAQSSAKYQRQCFKEIIAGDLRRLEMKFLARTDHSSILSPVKENIEAHKTAITAYFYTSGEERVAIATNALKISSICPEAYNILAEVAETIEEALKYYDEGIRTGPLVLTESEFGEACSTGTIWDCCFLRGLWRCMFGKGNLLRKTGRYEESLKVFKELIKVDQGFRGSQLSYVNFRIVVVDVLLSLKRYEECKQLLEDNQIFFGYQSSSITRIWTTILLDYILKGDVNSYHFSIAAGSARKVAPYIFGFKTMPAQPEPRIMGFQTSLSNAISYVRYNKKHWDIVEGAIQYAKRGFVQMIVNEMTIAESGKDTKRTIEYYEKYEHYETPQNFTKYYESSLLQAAAYSGNAQLVRFAIAKGFEVDFVNRDLLTALHMACYNGHLEVVKILVAKGASMTLFDQQGQSPVHMAANQGEHQCLQHLLDIRPELWDLKNQNGETPITSCFGSVARCTISIAKCERCLDIGSHAHSPNVDIQKTVMVLVEKGLDVNRTRLSLLHLCVSSYAFDVMTYLLPMMNTATKNKTLRSSSALHMLIQNPDPKGIYLNGVRILATQVDLAIKDANGNTALDIATKRRDREAADILINAGSQPTNTKDCLKMTCIHCKKLSGKLKTCPCHKASYCSSECQKADWRRHKKSEHTS